MAIISFMSTKGGTGKSLLTRLIATELADSGNAAVDLVCADHPQHSTFKCGTRRFGNCPASRDN